MSRIPGDESVQSFHVSEVEGDTTVISELDERDHVEEYLKEQRAQREYQRQRQVQQHKNKIRHKAKKMQESTHTTDTSMYDEFGDGDDDEMGDRPHYIPEEGEEDDDETSIPDSNPSIDGGSPASQNKARRTSTRKQQQPGLQKHLQNDRNSNGYNAVAWNTNASVAGGGVSVGMDTSRRSREPSMVGGGEDEYDDDDEEAPASKEAVHALHCAAVAAKTFDEYFMEIKNPQRENATPLFHAQELLTSREAIRQSGYYTEYALTAVRLLTENGQFGDPITAGMIPSSTSQKQQAARQRFMERSIDGHYAVKYLQAGLIEATDHGGTAAADMIYETRILMNLTPQHPNVAPIYGVNSGGIDTFLETARPKDGFFFITDRMTETLAERLDQWKKGKVSKKAGGKAKTPKLQDRIEVAFDISSALLFLHDRNIVYHIRPDKIGFDAKRGMVKLCNFSQARYDGMREHQSRSITKAADMTTLAYTAPELLCKSPGTASCDVYGFGIMLWELMSMRTPFEGYDRAKHFELVVQQHKRPPMNKKWNSDIKALLLGCWDPHLRLSMKKVNSTVEKILLVMIEEQEQFRIEREQNQDAIPQEVPMMTQPARTRQMRRNSTGGRGVYEEVMRQKEIQRQQQMTEEEEEGLAAAAAQQMLQEEAPPPRPRLSRRASTGTGIEPGVAPPRVTRDKSPSASNRSASPGPGRLRPRRRKSGNAAVTMAAAKENTRQATSLAQLPSEDYGYGYGSEIPSNSIRTSKTNPVMSDSMKDRVSVQSYAAPVKRKSARRASVGHIPATVKRAPLYRKREDGDLSLRQDDDEKLYESTGHLTEPTDPITDSSEPMMANEYPAPTVSPSGGSRLGLHQYAMQIHEGSMRQEREHGDLDGPIGPTEDAPKSPMKTIRRGLASVKEVFTMGARGVPREIGVDLDDDDEQEDQFDDSMLAYAPQSSERSTLRPPSNMRSNQPGAGPSTLRPPSRRRASIA